jgi:hypothetical protein
MEFEVLLSRIKALETRVEKIEAAQLITGWEESDDSKKTTGWKYTDQQKKKATNRGYTGWTDE